MVSSYSIISNSMAKKQQISLDNAGNDFSIEDSS